jgi:hypothetical protein
MSLDVVLNTPEITILGPPDSIDLRLEVGPRGLRGSRIFSGVGAPATNPTIVDPINGDLYIRTDPTAAGYVYQYLPSVTGQLQWVTIFSLNQLIYNARENVNFSAGTANITIPLYFIFGSFSPTLNLNDLNVVFSPETDRPAAISLASKIKVNSNADLRLTFVGREYRIGTESWEPIDGPVTMNLSISSISLTNDLEPPAS